jgi:uncharacterized protein
MLTAIVTALVDFCRRFAFPVAGIALAASILMGGYVITHFKINTDINQLLAADLGWRQREAELEKAFPQNVDQLVVVIDGDTADNAENAAANLYEKMQTRPDLFKNVTRPDNIPFFRKNGLLFLPENELSNVVEVLVQAQPLLGTLARDPSLRGLFGTLELVLEGLKRGDIEYKYLDKPFTLMANAIDSAIVGQDKPLPWRSLMSEEAPKPRDLRKFILTQPTLDYTSLEPGDKAEEAIRAMAQELNLTQGHGVKVRLTGSVALNDQEFASVAEGTTTATILSVVLVFVILFLALRSFRLIIPILLTLTAGLIATTAFAMATVGSLNLISVAFAVMFIGIAVDFGIQFGVRFRDQRHKIEMCHSRESGNPAASVREPYESNNLSDSAKAMTSTARIIAMPIALAAGSTALGFLTFIPTAYKGVAELGLIAGAGMIIAFILNITLLPALLALFRPPAEPEAIGYAWTAPIDRFLIAYRPFVLTLAAIVTIVGIVTATDLRFDFDPLDLKDAQTESVQTMFDIMKNPETNPYAIEILEPSLAAAQTLAQQIDKLPEVDHTMTLATFIPEDQDKKLSMISDANFILASTLNPANTLPAPTDEENLTALGKTATALHTIGADHPSADHLAKSLDTLVARHDPALVHNLHADLILGMDRLLDTVRTSLTAEHVTIDNITEDLRRDWITQDGRALLKVYPKNFPMDGIRDPKVLKAFTDAVEKIAPNASGTPVSIQESGRTIVDAFIQGGVSAVLAISLLAWIILRRVADVIRLIAPLILAGILTLATMVTIHLPLNFANIIALPLLLSLGVSYAIYFVSAWRDGTAKLLQSSVARAVLFSAATTTVAFGSLSISSHPGTASMGKLLTLALVYSLICTFLVLPALLGKPVEGKNSSDDSDDSHSS